MTLNLCAASTYRREAFTILSNRETSCCFAAKCAARSRRTRSSIVSPACCCDCCGDVLGGGTAPGPPRLGSGWWLAGVGCCRDRGAAAEAEDGDLEGEAGDEDFVWACGVLDVKRVASATLRGAVVLRPTTIVLQTDRQAGR